MSRTPLHPRIVAAAMLLSVVGCDKAAEPQQPAAPGISQAARQEATEIFSSRCSPCHGAQGRGDGPAAAGLTPRPRNFADRTWQRSVTDEQLARVIQQGGVAVGKSPAMPANPDLQAKPEVVTALVAHVRGLRP